MKRNITKFLAFFIATTLFTISESEAKEYYQGFSKRKAERLAKKVRAEGKEVKIIKSEKPIKIYFMGTRKALSLKQAKTLQNRLKRVRFKNVSIGI